MTLKVMYKILAENGNCYCGEEKPSPAKLKMLEKKLGCQLVVRDCHVLDSGYVIEKVGKESEVKVYHVGG